MGDRRIFLKTRRNASFNKDLSNEPNFDWIHLAGQYLQGGRYVCNSRQEGLCLMAVLRGRICKDMYSFGKPDPDPRTTAAGLTKYIPGKKWGFGLVVN